DLAIGRATMASEALDAAAIQLDPGVNWTAEILDIGGVTGAHAITDADGINQDYPVKKRGISTLLTQGVALTIDHEGAGIVTLTDANGQHYTVGYHHYENGILIEGPAPDGFGKSGDSGSAVLNSANEVVGILSSAAETMAVALPIQ